MSEMIFGNTGRNDEPINIDMAENLYKKLQTRNYVSTLKSMLAVGMDKSFVFLGDVDGYSIYGYNSRLENDNRGGNYGHYIAEKLGEKTADFKIDNEQFLTEKGFNECVQQKKSNDRFTVKLQPVEFNENAKKRLVHNFVEMFSNRGRKRNISFSIDDNDIDSFNAKSIFVFSELIKYLPYQIRKNIGFISHISSRERLPEYINIVGYSISATYKPHDCIDISDDTPIKNDCRFYDYVETVFAMDDGARKAYFDMLYENIEKYAPIKNSDMYDLDLKTRPFWESGDEKEAVEDIFNSEEKILKVYPAFIDIAGNCLKRAWNPTVLEYTKKYINSTKNVDELKNEYQKNCSFWELWEMPFPDDVKKQFREHAKQLISESAADEDKFIQTVDEIRSICDEFIDRDHLLATAKDIIGKKSDISSICGFLKKSDKYKQIFDADEFEKAAAERAREITGEAIKNIKNPCEKLNKFIELYSEKMPTCIKDVYDKFYNKFNDAANLEVDKVLQTLEGYNKEIKKLELAGKPLVHPNFVFYKKCFTELAEIAGCDDRERKKRINGVYDFVMQMFGKYLENNAVYDKYKEVDDNIYDEVLRIVELMDKNEGQHNEVADKLNEFHEYRHGINRCKKISDAVKYYKDHPDVRCDVTADKILEHWLEKHKPKESEIKKILKKYDKDPRTYTIINEYKKRAENNPEEGITILDICCLVLIAIALISVGAFGGIKIYEKRVVNDLYTEIDNLQEQLEAYKNPQPEAENEEKQKQEKNKTGRETDTSQSTATAPKTAQPGEQKSGQSQKAVNRT